MPAQFFERRKEMFIEVSPNLKKLSKFFPEHLFVVGGFVRNRLMGLQGGDVDICSCVDADEVARRLAGSEFDVKVKNLRLGSLLISVGEESFEYTAFRKEEYSQGGSHVPVKITRTDKIEEDAQRRDFTINAIYYNINRDECVDLLHGILDLTDKTIRAIGDAERLFESDGERILRMVRFAGELGFKIEKKTYQSAQKFVKNVGDLQGTRKLLELERILECDKKYGIKGASLKTALKLLNNLGIWEFFGLKKTLRYKNVFRAKERFFGLLLDIVDDMNPECLEAFLEKFLREQFGLSGAVERKIFVNLAGVYDALACMENKEYFDKYFENWPEIAPLLACKSKHLRQKYNFFYQYIIEHGEK